MGKLTQETAWAKAVDIAGTQNVGWEKKPALVFESPEAFWEVAQALAALSAQEPAKQAELTAEQKYAMSYGQQMDAKTASAFVSGIELGREEGAASREPVEAEPVAWAVTAPKGGIHKLCITRDSAVRKMAHWLTEWPDNKCSIRPLIFGDTRPLSPVAGEVGKALSSLHLYYADCVDGEMVKLADVRAIIKSATSGGAARTISQLRTLCIAQPAR